MTLAQELGLADRGSHVTARPRKGYFTQEDQEYVIRKICCGTCGTTLSAVVHRVGEDADLVWPFRVECLPTLHRLRTRAHDEDANTVVDASCVKKTEATKFLKHFVPERK